MESKINSGNYEVKLVKLEKGVTKNGNDKLSIEFVITDGPYTGRHLWYNQPINNEHGRSVAYKFLIALDADVIYISPNRYKLTYQNMNEYISQIADEVIGKAYCYRLNYSINESTGFNTYELEGPVYID